MSKPKDNNPSRGGLIRLTARCTAAGCAGKLGPADLSAVLARLDLPSHPDLLAAISTRDDAGVFSLSDDLAIVSTVDLFTPVVDDPFTYGQISAAGALSGVYAMGGLPRIALSIVCWPQTGLPGALLAEIIRGASEKAREAGVVIVGGHTVANENEEVKFGMAVTGVIDPHRIVRNVGAQAGDALVLTKALGTGILMTAFKRDKLADEPYQGAVRSMSQLNAAAASAMLKYDVHAATGITGFGLAGHALKMAEGSAVTIVFEESDLPLLPGVLEQCRAGMIPWRRRTQSRVLRAKRPHLRRSFRRDRNDCLRSADLGRIADRDPRQAVPCPARGASQLRASRRRDRRPRHASPRTPDRTSLSRGRPASSAGSPRSHAVATARTNREPDHRRSNRPPFLRRSPCARPIRG